METIKRKADEDIEDDNIKRIKTETGKLHYICNFVGYIVVSKTVKPSLVVLLLCCRS